MARKGDLEEGAVIYRRLDRAQEPHELLLGLKEAGFTDEDISQGTGTDERSVRRWKAKEPNPMASERLAEIRNLAVALKQSGTLSDRGIIFWSRHPNRLLEDYSPLRVIAAGGFRSARDAALCFVDSERPFEERIPEEMLAALRKGRNSRHTPARHRSKRLAPVA
jgi:hypothetical protein